MERLVLDTSVWIAIERGLTSFDEVFNKSFQVLLPAMVLSELKSNSLDPSRGEAHRQMSMEFVHVIEQLTEFVPVDKQVVRSYVDLSFYCRSVGKPRGTADLLIAATAVAMDAALITLDKAARFEELPNVRVVA